MYDVIQLDNYLNTASVDLLRTLKLPSQWHWALLQR